MGLGEGVALFTSDANREFEGAEYRGWVGRALVALWVVRAKLAESFATPLRFVSTTSLPHRIAGDADGAVFCLVPRRLVGTSDAEAVVGSCA